MTTKHINTHFSRAAYAAVVRLAERYAPSKVKTGGRPRKGTRSRKQGSISALIRIALAEYARNRGDISDAELLEELIPTEAAEPKETT